MCSFTVLGGGVSGCSEKQSVSGVSTICLTQFNTSPSHKVDHYIYIYIILFYNYSCVQSSKVADKRTLFASCHKKVAEEGGGGGRHDERTNKILEEIVEHLRVLKVFMRRKRSGEGGRMGILIRETLLWLWEK